jgi:hypothetical protein
LVAGLKQKAKGNSNDNSRSLRDDNKKGNGKSNSNDNSRSLRDDNKKGNGKSNSNDKFTATTSSPQQQVQ